MRPTFGTDGLRGVANSELTPELALAVGRAAARVLSAEGFLVGRDTRVSGAVLQSALVAGMASEGAEVVDLGVLPTPGVALLAADRGRAAAVVSASHNPFADNGIKLFGHGGVKLDEATEARIEAELDAVLAAGADGAGRPTGAGVGRITSDPAAAGDYIAHLIGTVDGLRLDGRRVVVDCACGAASAVAPAVLRALGADTEVIADRPDGLNINDGCGSTHPDRLRRRVVEVGAEVGLALDGDADRVLMVDASGELVDGDQLMALLALDMLARGALPASTVAVTVMSNLGFRLAMEEAGVHVHETPVGDRHILAALEENGWALGGEQSGHIILRRLSPTGDGLLTGLQVLAVMTRSGRSLADLAAAGMVRLPQELRSVRVARPKALPESTDVWDEVAAVEGELSGRGRVLVRASGTEPVVRVMVEAPEPDTAQRAVDRICRVVEAALS
ncbi:MAG TPA: phosphoglucosamine mutase [Acidimicrobiales bacterium]|nr:phosphoglucosamine mutase [Acidimicrobiales bacterium]